MLDLTHLAHQTAGNIALQREVLGLFVQQIDVLLGRLRSGGSEQERSAAAHVIVGSAAAIGAFEVVRFARRIELSGKASDGDVAELVAAVDETRAFIAGHLSR